MKLKKQLIKDYKTVHIDELAKAPVYALFGVTVKNALTLYKTLHIETIRDLANLEYSQWACEICIVADHGGSLDRSKYRERLVKAYYDTPPVELAEAPLSAFYGLSKKSARLLKNKMHIITIRDLAELKQVRWAQNIDYKQKLIKEYEDWPLIDLISAPVYALQGLSKKDAMLLDKAFNVETIEDLASLKYVKWAREICAIVDEEIAYPDMRDFENKLIKRYEDKPPEKLVNAPLFALQGLSKGDAEKLNKAFRIKTIRKLAELKYVKWAEGIVELSNSAVSMEEKPEKKSSVLKKIFIFLGILVIIGLIVAYFCKDIKKFIQGFQKGKEPVVDEIPKIPETVKDDTESKEQEAVNKKEEKQDVKKVEEDDKPVQEEKTVAYDGSRIYTAEVKDSLVSISEKVYGTYKRWPEIYQLNRHQIKRPWHIWPGQRLKLPK